MFLYFFKRNVRSFGCFGGKFETETLKLLLSVGKQTLVNGSRKNAKPNNKT